MKRQTYLRGLSNMRTLSSTRQRSIPRKQRSVEIEIYLLNKEKERFETEADRLERRYAAVQERIKNIDEEVARLREVMPDSANSPKGATLARPKNTGSLIPDDDGDWVTKKMRY